MTKPTCDYCRQPYTKKRQKQRFCCSNCRMAWHREHRLPGKITGLRALKRGGWSVTVYYTEQPPMQIGSAVRLENV